MIFASACKSSCRRKSSAATALHSGSSCRIIPPPNYPPPRKIPTPLFEQVQKPPTSKITAHHSNPRFKQISNKFKNSPFQTVSHPKTQDHSPSFNITAITVQKPPPKSCPSLNPENPGSDNFPELVLNSVKKQSCRYFAAKLPFRGQSCSKFHFQPNPQILRKPPSHIPKRRYPLHPPRHTPNPTKKHPSPDLAPTAAASGNQRQYRGDTTSQKLTPRIPLQCLT